MLKFFIFTALSFSLCLATPLVIEEGSLPIGVTLEPPNETTPGQEIQFDGEDDYPDFKYPTTPLPSPVGEEAPTIPPNIEPDNENDGGLKVVNGPIITGNQSCQCGTSARTKIVGGEAVPISELPWTAALVRKKENATQIKGPYCGGTLVNTRYVVTASHCVDAFKAEKIQVWLNEEDFRVEDETLTGTLRIDVEEIIMHQDYDRNKIKNDIALLKLAQPVDIVNTIRPVCLPADGSESYDNEKAIVAGWGATEQGGSVSSTLQKVVVPIIPNKVCNWRTLYLGQITDTQICAGELSSGGKDSCQGDSGGPLVLNRGENGQKLLVGVVSFGFGCARPFAPGVYTRVSKYPEWIVENSVDADYCSS
ncbi:trypsin-1 isoform X1 [Folsomia candida]|uniref:trypsin-1 isoform X1 n=1 Tax=Folsomia candida TaxID=158441 RepID=UPI000B906712|nr:trypsin-1 isoform X1 [Folsomia candida]